MVASVKHIDVVEHPSDVLVYSTNVFLNCSGGVGSTLLTRYGNRFQEDLHNLLKSSNVNYASQGSIYEHVSEGMPYKAVFHTVPCDGFYDTSKEIVSDILRRCMDQPEEFIRIASEVLSDVRYSELESATVCIYDEYLYNQACKQIRLENLKLLLA